MLCLLPFTLASLVSAADDPESPVVDPGKPGGAPSDAIVLKLRCEYRENPMGIDGEKPRLSWKIEERSQELFARGQKQIAFQKREGKRLTMEVTIPINTTATVYVPAKNEANVTESGNLASKAEGVKFLRMENGAVVYEVGPGCYRFCSEK